MTRFVTISCYRCKEQFGMAEDTHAHLRRSAQSFWCPNGHEQHFPLGPTEAQKLQSELDRTLLRAQRAEQRVAQEQDRADHHKARAASYKGQVTKIKKRVGAGVCPCCNRTFQDLARHMAGQHPDFQPEGEDHHADVSD